MIRRENPARVAEIVGAVAETSPIEVDAVVWAADADFRRWPDTPLAERLALLTRAADAIEDALAGLAMLLTRETGKVVGGCRDEIGFAVRYLRWVVANAPAAYADRESDGELGRIIRQHKPYGVVAAITPWNAPVALALLKIAPALAAGNAVVVKPSPLAPLTLDRIVRLIDGPLRIVHGGAETGAALVGHDLVRKVAFSGGTAGGRAVAALAGDRLTPAVLELGGNDPAVFLDDAPFDAAAMDRLVLATFSSSSQVCAAAKRLYVPAVRLDDFVEAYLEAADRMLVTGDPLADGVTIGPVISAAAQKAAELLRTGDCRELGKFDADPRTGYFVRPALVVSPDPRGPLVAAEKFAPVVPVFGYHDEDAVLAAANAGGLGLGASVWSADADRAIAFARRFEAGFAFVNTHNRTGMSLRAPFGVERLAEYGQACVIHAPSSAYPV